MRQSETRKVLLNWHGRMCSIDLTDPEQAELRAWEKANVDGSGKFGTSDWPGWKKHIGKSPTFSEFEKPNEYFACSVSCLLTQLVLKRSNIWKIGAIPMIASKAIRLSPLDSIYSYTSRRANWPRKKACDPACIGNIGAARST